MVAVWNSGGNCFQKARRRCHDINTRFVTEFSNTGTCFMVMGYEASSVEGESMAFYHGTSGKRFGLDSKSVV